MGWRSRATPPPSSSNTSKGRRSRTGSPRVRSRSTKPCPIARQIAEALEAAHEQGIIHRDLKPANVKVKDDGTVKVLDFGLAKALQPELSDLDAANSPTMTMTAAATKMGVIMGTAAYMSPEQAKGRQVDKRADIWAFGVVLFEMLTGRQAFQGEDLSSTLAKVIEREPDWTQLPTRTPSAIQTLLRRCLSKDRKRRIPDIGIANIEIDDTLSGASEPTDTATAAVAQPALWQRPAAAIVLGLGIALVAGLAVWSLTRPAPALPAPIIRTSVVLPQTQVRTNTGRRGVAISPTGTHVVYVANSQLYLRALDELEAQPLTGTEGSVALTPFFSPDGQWIGFYSRRDNALKKVAISGGAAVTLTEAAATYGASWGADDTIVFGQGGQGILRVAGAGGTPDVLVAVEPPNEASQPQMLPGGGAVLYTLGVQGQWDEAQIVVEQVATGKRTVVVEGGSDARYLPTGHLVYALGDTLLAVPFDLERVEVTGGPVPLVEGVSRAGATGAANADIARTGTLVYLPDGSGSDVRTLVWVDREGREEPIEAEPRSYRVGRISPDGTKVALELDDQERDIWIYDFGRETLTRLTFGPVESDAPVWTPDGLQVIFGEGPPDNRNLYRKAADGTGTVEQLTEGLERYVPYDVTPDGDRLVVAKRTTEDNYDLYVLSLAGEPTEEPLFQTEFNELGAALSPDGRWLAYQSDASGRFEVYVRPFPDVDDGRYQISTGEGVTPLWGPDGQELFYGTPSGEVMRVPIQTAPTFAAGNSELALEAGLSSGRNRYYDITPNGDRFLRIKQGASTNIDDPFADLTQIHVVQNWFSELQARVPTGR